MRVSLGATEKLVRPSGAIRAYWLMRLSSDGDAAAGFFFESKDVDVQDAFAVEAVLEEVDEFLRLLIELVVGGVETVAAEPAMGDECAVFGAGVLCSGGQWSGAACGRSDRWRRCLCGRRAAATAS